MAGIPRPNTQHAGEDELIFHLELGENPPPVSTVATFDDYLFNRHNDIESSRPVKGYALGGPQGSSHELEPRSPSSLHPSSKVMAAQATEALNRTFIDLKSKNEETRLRASYDLRELVVSAARGEAFPPIPLILRRLTVHEHSATFRQIPRILYYCQYQDICTRRAKQ